MDLKRRASVVAILLLMVSLAAFCAEPMDNTGRVTSWTQFPALVQSFRRQLLTDKTELVQSYFQFPVTVYEMAYEPCEGCRSFFHKTQVTNIDQLVPYLDRLADAWDDDNPIKSESNEEEGVFVSFFSHETMMKPCDVVWYGVTVQADAEHHSGVGIKKNKVQAFILDAENNEWAETSKGFIRFDPGECVE